MQLLQTTILKNTIQPGIIPIFIISPYVEDGLLLASILSNNIITPKKYQKLSGIINEDNNYFYNEDVKNLLASKNITHKKNETLLKTKLSIEEGMNNGKLWGLLCSYHFFNTLEIRQQYPNAYFLFLYNDKTNDIDANNIITNYENCINNSYIIGEKQVKELGGQLLKHLSFYKEIIIKPYKKNKYAFEIDKGESLTQVSIIKHTQPKLQELDVFIQPEVWLKGTDCTFILIINKDIKTKLLQEKLKQIEGSFVESPMVFILNTDSISNNVSYADGKIQFIQIENQEISSVLNKIVNQCNGHLIIDNLRINTSPVDILNHFKTLKQPAFVTSTLDSSNTNNNTIELVDVLTSHLSHDQISFSSEKFHEIGGFDEQINDTWTLWDFSIRLLEISAAFAIEIQGKLADDSLPTNRNKEFSETYQFVIQKHKPLFRDSLNEVVRRISEKQHLPQHEIKSLHYKIMTLQSLLDHSKDELKALNELSSTLQHRINILEDRWYFKLGKKLQRIKKIFFKKKSPGTGTLKRILQFMRFALSKAGFAIVRKVIRNVLKKMYLLAEDRPVRIVFLDDIDNGHIGSYHEWIKHKLESDVLKNTFNQEFGKLKWTPKISIIMPVYEPPLKFLRQAIESVIKQQYTNWELCIADDYSPNTQVQHMLKVYAAKDSRIKIELRTENGHISAASNSALSLATGEFVLLMDHDDLLTENCLFEVIKHINNSPEQEIIYSDEDKINDDEIHSMPHFKPDWAPHNLLSRNYFGHVVVIKKQIIDKINGFRLGFEGSQDYDLILRATEMTQKIGHIPKVLYHWRIHSKSAAQSEEVKPYAYIAAKKALEEALQRRQTPGEVQYLSGLRGYRIKYDVTKSGKVSIIIPTKDQVHLTQNTIDSIIRLTSYKNYEIILLNNNSTSSAFFEMVKLYEAKYPTIFHCIQANFHFNFAKLMNVGVAESSGDYILFLNNDMEVIHEDWLTTMVAHAQHQNTGAVGAKLLYPDDHIQHAGVIVGLGGVAGHAFVHAHKDESGYFNYIQSMNNFSAVTAACLLFRKEIYEQVSGMSEEFEVEYNDVDFCLKIIQAGYYNVYLPDVELYHYESSTRGHPHQSKESWERHVREIALFKQRWQSVINADPFYNPNLNIGTHDFSLNFSA